MHCSLGARVLTLVMSAALCVACVTIVTPGSTSIPSAEPTTPALPTIQPTPIPNFEPTPAPTAQPTPTHAPRPTRGPTPNPTAPPVETASPTPSPTPPPTPAPTLRLPGPSERGTIQVQAGIVEVQPYALSAQAGGPIDASTLGDGCRGFVDVRSDVTVELTQPAPPLAPASLLRFYFISPGDSTLIIKFGQTSGWDSRWYCTDDSYGTLHPTVDFGNPAWGTYKVWIGSLVPSDHPDGTLHVTTVADNHP